MIIFPAAERAGTPAVLVITFIVPRTYRMSRRARAV